MLHLGFDGECPCNAILPACWIINGEDTLTISQSQIFSLSLFVSPPPHPHTHTLSLSLSLALSLNTHDSEPWAVKRTYWNFLCDKHRELRCFTPTSLFKQNLLSTYSLSAFKNVATVLLNILHGRHVCLFLKCFILLWHTTFPYFWISFFQTYEPDDGKRVDEIQTLQARRRRPIRRL